MASERRLGIAARLQELYRADDTARALFDDAAERSYSVARTSVDRIARVVGTTRARAADLCKLLDSAWARSRESKPANGLKHHAGLMVPTVPTTAQSAWFAWAAHRRPGLFHCPRCRGHFIVRTDR